MVSLWDLYASVYDSLPKHFQPYQELVAQVVEEVRTYSDKGTVLDAGCGTGNFSIALAKSGYDVTGIDYSASMLKRAERKKRNAGNCNVRFLKLDLRDQLPYPDNYFDKIVSIHALYTIKDTEPILEEYYRVLRPNGQFVLSEFQRPVRIMPVLREAMRRRGLREAINLSYHLFSLGLFSMIVAERQASSFYHYWSESELRGKLSYAGFKVISVKEAYTDNLDLLITSVKLKTDS